MRPNLVHVSSFYRFKALPQAELAELQCRLEEMADDENVRGLCLIGPEGINATLSGSEEGIQRFKAFVGQTLEVDTFKDSVTGKHPFSQFRVKIKDEIVTIGQPGLVPPSLNENHLSPAEWRAALRDPEVVLLDTRNDYEVQIGKFNNAIDLNLTEFQEFPEKVQAAQIPKEKKVLMYCTGGIRCEKAILEMRQQGFENVFQLQGGILEYLKEYPNEDFAGECFVFDYRIAVDQNLNPTQRYRFCPHCGQPGEEVIHCAKCSREEIICGHCKNLGGHRLTCSKNCAHHFQIGSASTKPHAQELEKRSKTAPN